MKMKKATSLLLAALMVIGLLAGCGTQSEKPAATTAAPTEAAAEAAPSTEEAAGTRTVTDMAGRQVEIPAEVTRIATLESTARIVTYAGAADKIVGLSDIEKKGEAGMPYAYVNHEQFADLAGVQPGGPSGEYYDEALATLNPDLIFTIYGDMDALDTMQQKLGVPVIALAFQGVFSDSLYEAINLVGQVMGTEAHAEDVVNHMKAWQQDLNDRTKDIPTEEKPTVYPGAVSFRGGHGIEGTYANYPPLQAINAINVVDETGEKGAVMLDKEKLIVWDPDIIFLTPGNMHFVNEDYAVNPDLYNNLSAVKNGKVYSQVSYNYFYTNVELAIADAYYAGTVVFPEQFKDVNFEEKAEEIFTVMLGQPYLEVLKANGDFFGPIEIGK